MLPKTFFFCSFILNYSFCWQRGGCHILWCEGNGGNARTLLLQATTFFSILPFNSIFFPSVHLTEPAGEMCISHLGNNQPKVLPTILTSAVWSYHRWLHYHKIPVLFFLLSLYTDPSGTKEKHRRKMRYMIFPWFMFLQLFYLLTWLSFMWRSVIQNSSQNNWLQRTIIKNHIFCLLKSNLLKDDSLSKWYMRISDGKVIGWNLHKRYKPFP